jgi:hypothetical protein
MTRAIFLFSTVLGVNTGGTMRRVMTWVMVVALLGVTNGHAVRAQRAGEVESLLPDSQSIGQGWSEVGGPFSISVDPNNGTGVSGFVEQRYVGPKGARARIRITIVAPGMTNAVSAVQSYDEYLRSHRDSLVETAAAYDPDDIQRLPNLFGCDDNFRAAGDDPFDFFPEGGTACVMSETYIVNAVVSGVITDPRTNRMLNYHQASDYLVAMVVEAILLRESGSPVASPPTP